MKKKYPPYYRIRWHKKNNEFEIMIKFKFASFSDAVDKCEELAVFEPYISPDRNKEGKLTWTIYINRQSKIWEFCEMNEWKDPRPAQQHRMNCIKDFLQSRYSMVGIKARQL